jgi:hypothetical protein
MNLPFIKDKEKTIEFNLSGDSQNRRKQLRKIQREYPNCKIIRNAPITAKKLGDKRVACEDANTPQTHVVVFIPDEK